MKKINIKIAFIQFLGIVFLIDGILQLKFYTVAEKVLFVKNYYLHQPSGNWNKFFATKEAFFNFWPSVYIWISFGLITGIALIAFQNWKNKFSPLNTFLVAIALYILLRFRFFRKGTLAHALQPIRNALSDNFGTQCLIQGIIFTLIGLTFLYLSSNPNLFISKKIAVKI